MRGARHRLLRELAARDATRSAPTRSPTRTDWSDYGANVWGLTASDGPIDATLRHRGRSAQFHTYWARGAGIDDVRDDGTIAPTAAAASIAVRARDRDAGDRGDARDATATTSTASTASSTPSIRRFDSTSRCSTAASCPALGWFDTDYLGIDQGPIVLMIENYRSEFVWKRDASAIRTSCRGLRRAGFTGGWLDHAGAPAVRPLRGEERW